MHKKEKRLPKQPKITDFYHRVNHSMVKLLKTSLFTRIQDDFDKFCDGEKNPGAII